MVLGKELSYSSTAPVDGTRGHVERDQFTKNALKQHVILLGLSMFPVTADVIGPGLSLREDSFRTVNV